MTARYLTSCTFEKGSRDAHARAWGGERWARGLGSMYGRLRMARGLEREEETSTGGRTSGRQADGTQNRIIPAPDGI
jgi:hypothetical protein